MRGSAFAVDCLRIGLLLLKPMASNNSPLSKKPAMYFSRFKYSTTCLSQIDQNNIPVTPSFARLGQPAKVKLFCDHGWLLSMRTEKSITRQYTNIVQHETTSTTDFIASCGRAYQ